MKLEISYGHEIQDSHFNRCSVPDQGWMLHTMDQQENLIKGVWHYFGSDAAKSNWTYTLSCLNQFLSDFPASNLTDTNQLTKLVFIRLLSLLKNSISNWFSVTAAAAKIGPYRFSLIWLNL